MDRNEIKQFTGQAFNALTAWTGDPDGFEITGSNIAQYTPGPNDEIKLINGFVNLAGLLLTELERETKRDRASLMQHIGDLDC
jgi:hypothetical protein